MITDRIGQDDLLLLINQNYYNFATRKNIIKKWPISFFRNSQQRETTDSKFKKNHPLVVTGLKMVVLSKYRSPITTRTERDWVEPSCPLLALCFS